HEVIALSKNHQARWRPDPANNVRDGVRVTGERSNTGLRLLDDRPYERSRRRMPRDLRLGGGASRASHHVPPGVYCRSTVAILRQRSIRRNLVSPDLHASAKLLVEPLIRLRATPPSTT